MNYKIGKRYKAMGNCGITDETEVIGKLERIETSWNAAIIWDEKRDLPCSVWIDTLEEITQ